MQLHIKLTGIFSALVLLMAATRYNHFGSTIALPDATLAIFLLAGFFFARTKMSPLAFTLLILEAGGIDYYAINVAGTSDWCVTPAYWLLIPTYASMWLGGRWFAAHRRNTWNSLALFGVVAWLSVSTAFLISNAGFFLLSGYFPDMGGLEYAERIAKYYLPYLSGSLIYLALASVTFVSFVKLQRTRTSVSTNWIK